MTRTGNTYGALIVLDDRGTMLFCRCKCGREGLYPSAITKPTYKGRRQCTHCSGRPCEICGKWMDAKPGRQAATCSDTCRKIRASRRETARYARIKSSDAWISARKSYLTALRTRRADPEFDEAFRRAAASRTAQYTEKTNADPAARHAYLQKKRGISASWRAALMADPVRYAAHRQAARDWYRQLSPQDRDRIYYARRRKDKNEPH